MRTIVNLFLVLGLLSIPVSHAVAEQKNSAALQTKESHVQLWLVSTRDLPVDSNLAENALNLKYSRYLPNGDLVDATRQEFEAGDSATIPTMVIVHGSPATYCEVLEATGKLSKLLHNNAPAGSSGRVVIWTWPSDKVRKRMIPDFRVKAGWSEYQGYYLARFIQRVKPEVPLSLSGYSFGARAVGTALHLLGGGSLPCEPELVITKMRPRKKPISVLFIAAGIDSDWLFPDSRYGKALSVVSSALVTTNSCDPLLKRYHLLCSLRGGPAAIGYQGVCDVSQLGSYQDRFKQIDVAADAGKSHDVYEYLKSKLLKDRVMGLVFSQQ